MEGYKANNVEFVGYCDLDKKPGFKMGIKVVDGQWYMYAGHLWHSGWSIINVTDPANPKIEKFIPGPANTFTLNVQVADDLLITSLEPTYPGWGATDETPDEGVIIWDIKDPLNPRKLSHWRTGGKGIHRVYYDGGRYMYCPCYMKGYTGLFLVIMDIIDPEHPVEVSRWFLPEQFSAGGADTRKYYDGDFYGIHDVYAEGNSVYIAYGRAGMVILDITDITNPTLVGHATLGTLFASVIGLHTAMPINDQYAIFTTEGIDEDCTEPLNLSGIIDISDETHPRVISLFPLPEPPEDAGYTNFKDHGGRFAPHNIHQQHHNPWLMEQKNLVYETYFNAGLRIYDISDPYMPKEVGYFLPDDPKERLGVLPATLVTQSEDVLVDARGFAYIMDKNHGMYIVRYTGDKQSS